MPSRRTCSTRSCHDAAPPMRAAVLASTSFVKRRGWCMPSHWPVKPPMEMPQKAARSTSRWSSSATTSSPSRSMPNGAPPLAAVVNFTPVSRPGYQIGLPRPGRWREILNTDAAVYGGTDCGNAGGVDARAGESHGYPFCAHVTLPPLGAPSRNEAKAFPSSTLVLFNVLRVNWRVNETLPPELL